MRKELSKLNNLRKTFTGTFKRYGTKTNFKGFPEDTILLINIKDSNGKVVSDHCWFNLTKQFSELGELTEGNIIQFDARIKEYIKGYHGRKAEELGEDTYEEDYKLSFPTKLKRIKEDIKTCLSCDTIQKENNKECIKCKCKDFVTGG